MAQFQPSQGGAPMVLIADDEPTVLEVTRRLARSLGWRSLLADNADQAVELMREYSTEIDCVLIDLHMPGVHGLSGVRRLRQIDPRVRIVVMTGDDQNAALDSPGTDWPDAVLVKPFMAGALSTALSNLRAEAA